MFKRAFGKHQVQAYVPPEKEIKKWKKPQIFECSLMFNMHGLKHTLHIHTSRNV